MSELPRLKWSKAGRGFKAYPIGDHHSARDQRYAEIWRVTNGIDTDSTPHRYVESWCWVVRWDGWFAYHGFEPGKQEAADKATEEWWKAVQTDLPRDVDLEVAMIVARAPVRPLPNSLLGEDAEFLRKVNWHLHDLYGAALKREEAPGSVKDLVARLSEELHRRRLAGPQPERAEEPAISGGYRRRRR